MNDVSRSWFCVFNNPRNYGYEGEPHEIVEKLIEEWLFENPTRTCAVTYCLSAEGLEHCHAVFEDVKAMRFSIIKKVFPSMHIEPTKGNKEQAEDYINKKGKWEEKGEIILYSQKHGEIKGAQGQRNDLAILGDLIEQGKRPSEILSMSMQYRKYENMIKSAYYDKRKAETPFLRKVKVYWHVGDSGSGKSYVAKQIVDEKGEDAIYFMTDYEGTGFDNYNGETILFMDEFRGQIKYSVLLSSILQGYKSQLHARYSNAFALWNEVHITSVLPPERVYKNMVSEHRDLDTIDQLKRRIDVMVYHWKNEKDEYCQFELDMKSYISFEMLRDVAVCDLPF